MALLANMVDILFGTVLPTTLEVSDLATFDFITGDHPKHRRHNGQTLAIFVGTIASR